MMQFIIVLIIQLSLIIGVVLLEGGNPLIFLGLTPWLILLGIPAFSALGVWKAGFIGRAFGDALGKQPDKESAARSIRIWAFYERLFYLSSVMLVTMGLVYVLSRLSDPKELSRTLAYCLAPFVPGIFLGLLSRIFRYRIFKHFPENRNTGGRL